MKFMVYCAQIIIEIRYNGSSFWTMYFYNADFIDIYIGYVSNLCVEFMIAKYRTEIQNLLILHYNYIECL